MNGDISVEGLEHDRLQSRIPLRKGLVIFYSKKISPDISQVEMSGEIFCFMQRPQREILIYMLIIIETNYLVWGSGEKRLATSW